MSPSSFARFLYPSWLFAFWRGLVGLAQDYWKDGNEKDPDSKNIDSMNIKGAQTAASPPLPQRNIQAAPVHNLGLWHAQPGEISEKMWGDGRVTPGDDAITDMLINPLGVTRDMNLLDLSAGLGARLHRAIKEFGVYIDGFEPDTAIAARSMQRSKALGHAKHAVIQPYDPMDFHHKRTYDCVVMRETIYRVPDKKKFITSVVDCCKPAAQVSFTDYIVEPQDRDHPAVRDWCAFEKGSEPLGLEEMAALWKEAGISLRIRDDQTRFYKAELKRGLVRLASFLASGVKPDPETWLSITKRVETIARRAAAMEVGLKFYRFYGLR